MEYSFKTNRIYMADIKVIPVYKKKDITKFVKFHNDLYADCPYAVPELYMDQYNTLGEKNAARDFCDAQLFLAYRDDKIVGRVVAIINRKANETWNRKCVRFGWIDFIDDDEVSKALLDTVEQWGKERGMDEIQGPLGFTDMDPEGMLYEGQEELGTMVTIYNYKYYIDHMERHGYEKDADWIEWRLIVPRETGVPERLLKVSSIVEKKYGAQIVKFKKAKQIAKTYGREIFDVINAAFAPLFGYSELTDRQKDQYVKMYLSIVDPKLVSTIADKDGKLIGVGICMPSLSEALQKCKGKLFPFGWFHLLKALKWKHANHLEMLLIAVRPEWQSKGVNALFFKDLLPYFISEGYEWCETSVELERNSKVQSQWIYFDGRIHKRRRCWKKSIK